MKLANIPLDTTHLLECAKEIAHNVYNAIVTDKRIAIPTAIAGYVVSYYSIKYLWELPKLRDLERRAVLVTGCDSGFGLQLVLQLKKTGIPVFAGCLTNEGVQRITEQASSITSGRLVPFLLDITSEVSVQDCLQFVQSNLETDEYLWALVNNAGAYTVYGPDDWTQPELYLKSFEINCLGGIRMTHAFKPLLKKSQGRIITMSSIVGFTSFPNTGPYSVAKHGVEAYIDALRPEMSEFNVRCILMEPSGFRTPFVGHSAQLKRTNDAWNSCSQTTRDEYGKKYREEWLELFERKMISDCSTNTHEVTDNYFHAITAKHPRDRYKCGWPSILFYTPLSMMPTSVYDWILGAVARPFVKKGTLQIAALQKH